jgi:hypothetical protein
MPDQRRQRTLVETPEFTAQFDDLIRRHSDALIGPPLAAAMWGIATNPQAYSRVIGTIRIAKTRSLGLAVPALRIFFQILDESAPDERVLLCFIEEDSGAEDDGVYLT